MERLTVVTKARIATINRYRLKNPHNALRTHIRNVFIGGAIILTILSCGRLQAADWVVEDSTELWDAVHNAALWDMIVLRGTDDYLMNAYGVIDINTSMGIASEGAAARVINGAFSVGYGTAFHIFGSMEFRNGTAAASGTDLGGAFLLDGGTLNVWLQAPGEYLWFEGNTDSGGDNAIHLTPGSVLTLNLI